MSAMRDGYGGAACDAVARFRRQHEVERRRIHELKNRFAYAGTSEDFHQQEEDYEGEEYDGYGEEPSEPEEEEEPEPPKPTMEEQEFLKLRQQLKDKIRQKLKKQSASAFGHLSQSQDKKRTASDDNLISISHHVASIMTVQRKGQREDAGMRKMMLMMFVVSS